MPALPRRVARIGLAIAAIFALAACGTPIAVPDREPGFGGGPVAPPDQPYGPYPTLPVTGDEPPTGNTGERYPVLSVGLEPRRTIELVDPEARAWWIVVSGTGEHRGDRLEIVAEAGDIWPGAVVREFVDGDLTETTDLTGLLGSTTAIAGSCHPTLGLCYSSDDVSIDAREGRLWVVLEGDASSPLEVRGAVASFDGEAFDLGPWRGTERVLIDQGLGLLQRAGTAAAPG